MFIIKRLKGSILNYEVIMTLLMMAFVVVLMVDSHNLTKVGKMFPQGIGFVALVLLLTQLYQSLRQKPGGAETVEHDDHGEIVGGDKPKVGMETPKLLLTFVLLMAVYWVMMVTLGYMLATLIIMPITMWVLGMKRIIVLITTTVLVVASIQVIFVNIFKVSLPGGMFW
ncbi:MAG TPA: tripartite tricarboxylate transporter TctB family protein [Clostridia bacterium]|nr:tripartite tricarboxylate transporter TctB family protein [Clostridia bacterium]